MTTTDVEVLEYTGKIVSLGAAEMGQSGKEKPRKVVITDKPEYQGKTFRCWSSSAEFVNLELAAREGNEVTVGYHVSPIPNTTYTQNMIDWVNIGGANPDDDWGTPPPAEEPPWEQPAHEPTAPVHSVRHAAQPSQSERTDKDRLITVTAITKSLCEGGYCPVKPTNEQEFRKLVSDLVVMVEGLAK